MHPDPVTYAELVDRNTRAATIKSLAPGALVFGSVNYGYNGYVNLQNAPDPAASGEYLDYYLSRMQAAGSLAGRRLVDVLDLHWYPEAQGDGHRITDTGTTQGEVAAREQAPRSLWDPTYVETSWIAGDFLGNRPIRLLPWVFGKIGARYPGTRLSFSEYYYGGGGHISGAIAEADVLGIFGRDGVFEASLWPLDADTSFADAAFRMYRNVDGAGTNFGNLSIGTASTDTVTTSVYASDDAGNPGRMIVTALNKSDSPQSVGVRIRQSVLFHHAAVYQLTASGPQPRHVGDLGIAARNAFDTTLRAQSVTTFVLTP